MALAPSEYAAALDAALRAANIPIHGVSIGVIADRSTWRVAYNNATDQQQAAGAALVASFDPADPTVVQRDADQKADVMNDRRGVAFATATYQLVKAAVPGMTVTPTQWRAMLRAAWDASA